MKIVIKTILFSEKAQLCSVAWEVFQLLQLLRPFSFALEHTES